ncbi:PIF1 helicase [Elysia marginata]|uniref:PIF1 helicase n=1 Tax=Elysia marginata TaxID=1093978 RepID=A0AAV4IDE1_9GAST|nr:PIF1 helicase [Elysia marginata]
MLLHHKPGATRFTDLQTVDGINYDSFQECCHKVSLLDDDAEEDAAMMEATTIRFGPQLRLAFATFLIYCRPADPLGFWERHKLELCRDFMMRNQVSDLNHYIENQAPKKYIAIWGTNCLIGWGLATSFASCATWIKDGHCGSNTESFISLAVCDQIKTDTKGEGKTARRVVSIADYLLSIGDGRVKQHNEMGNFFIKLPDDITVTNEKELLDFVFGGIEDR